MSDTPAADEAANTTPAVVELDGFPIRDDGSFDVGAMTDELLAECLVNEKLTVDQLVAAAAGDATLAQRLLLAETSVTDGAPRKTAVTKLEAIITPPTAGTVPALLLTLGGAPAEWHVIRGVGHVHPTIPSPVGGDREPSLKAAETLAKDEGCAVKLVRVSEKQAQEGREARAQARGEGIEAARELRSLGKKATNADVNAVQTEVAAATGEE